MAALCDLLKELSYECVSGAAEREITDVIYDSRKVTEGQPVRLYTGGEGGRPQVCGGCGAGRSESPAYGARGGSAGRGGCDGDSGGGCPLCFCLCLGGLFRASCEADENHRHHGYERKNHYHISGEVHFGTGGQKGGADRHDRNHYRKDPYSCGEHYAAVLSGTEILSDDGGCRLRYSGDGGVFPRTDVDRTQGFVFDFGIFTNLEPDHIGENEHKDFDDYLHCKSLLFRQCRVGIANADDAHWREVTADCTCRLETYGIDREADLRAEDIAFLNEGEVWGWLLRQRD